MAPTPAAASSETVSAPGATDHEVRPPVGLGHVLDEGAHVGAHAGVGIALPTCLDPTLARLMPDIEADHAGEARQRVGHDGVEPDRALAAADHEDAHRAFASGEALRRRPQAR